jgi:GT2 family glycosyltransferase
MESCPLDGANLQWYYQKGQKGHFMDISVVIPTMDRPADIARCLDSLLRQTLPPDEIIVVDSSPNTRTEAIMATLHPPSPTVVRYVRSDKAHLPRQRNQGVAVSTGRYIHFFDDDVILEADCIRQMHAAFERLADAGVGGVMGRVTNVSARGPRWERIFKKLFYLSDLGQGRIKLSGFPSLKIDATAGYVGCLSGCCMAYRRDAFQDQAFDERLTTYAYMEDVDFSYRVSRRFRLYYEPAARLTHHPTTFKTTDSRLLRKMLVCNLLYLFRKNLPFDLPHCYGLCCAIAGMLIYNGLIVRDFHACRGILEGVFTEPLGCR